MKTVNSTNNKLVVISLFVLLFNSVIIAQVSVSIEAVGLNSNYFDSEEIKYNKGFSHSGAGLYLNVPIFVFDVNQIVLKPGYFIGPNYYSGFELGAFYKQSYDKIFGMVGINSHYNSGFGHGTEIVEVVDRGFSFSAGGSIGYKLTKSLALKASYFKTISENYGYKSVSMVQPEANGIFPTNIYWLISIGIEIKIPRYGNNHG